jgi:short-subunit dehydrogenase
MKNIVIFGATSSIAEQTARIYAGKGARLLLIARNMEKLAIIKDDLMTRGANAVDTYEADLADINQHESLINYITSKYEIIDIALIAYGVLGDQKLEEENYKDAEQSFTINCTSVLSLLHRLANFFEKQASGTIAVISSPSGDRGRQSNYIYGAAKGALSIYCQGLRNRLAKHKVHVLFMWVQSNRIAKGITKSIQRKKDTVYLPGIWRWIMLIIKLIPEKIFKRLKL